MDDELIPGPGSHKGYRRVSAYGWPTRRHKLKRRRHLARIRARAARIYRRTP
jgi:hypothetical protein